LGITQESVSLASNQQMKPFLFVVVLVIGLNCVRAQDDVDYMLKSGINEFVESNKREGIQGLLSEVGFFG
jgi:hypothetical protein